MQEAKQQLVRAWLTKARHDLAAARVLATAQGTGLDTAVFHCQQAAEKAVKGFLTFHDHRFGRTHDIRLLANLAAAVDHRFQSHVEAAQQLTPYAVVFRYPGIDLEPSREEFDAALCAADALCRFVLSLLPDDVHPPA